ncbi:response regulator [Gemmatimonas sp.]
MTDLHMPGRDGLALTEEVRARWPEMPVIIVSGLITDDLSARLRAWSNVSLLPKPFSEAQLRLAIEQAVPGTNAGAGAAPLRQGQGLDPKGVSG